MAPVHSPTTALEKPTGDRFPWARKLSVALVSAALLGSGGMVGAGEPSPLTVDAAVEQALMHPERLAEREAILDAATRTAQAARRSGANPQITWQEERRGSEVPSTTDYLWVTQGLGGVTTGPARRQEARATVAGAKARVSVDAQEVVAAVQWTFYEALWRQERGAQAALWHARLSEAAEATTVRQAAGDASRWELERLRVEVDRAQASLTREQAAHAETWARLAVFTGASPEEPVPLAGPLEPPPPPNDLGVAAIWGAALAADQQAAEARSTQLHRSWLESANVGAGLISERDPTGGDVGIMLTANLPLPISGQSRAQAATLQAEARRLEAQRSLEQARFGAQLTGASAAMSQHLAAAAQLAEAEARARALQDVAEVGWAGGELSLVEVLDTHHTAFETTVERLDAQLAARQAWIEITRLSQGDTP